MSEITGRLENWWVDPRDFEGEFVIWGNLYDDKHKRYVEGTFIHTSGIQPRGVKEGDIVETRNSTYLLGKEKVVE